MEPRSNFPKSVLRSNNRVDLDVLQRVLRIAASYTFHDHEDYSFIVTMSSARVHFLNLATHGVDFLSLSLNHVSSLSSSVSPEMRFITTLYLRSRRTEG